MFRRLTAGLAAVTLATVLTACSGATAPTPTSSIPADCKPQHTFKTLEPGVLNVSTYSVPPFAIVTGREISHDGVPVTQGGTLEGVDGDIINEIAAKECLRVEVNSTVAAGVIPTVRGGGADVGVGDWYRTRERAATIDFTHPVYVDPVAMISRDGISDVAQLPGRKVGTVHGYQYVAELRAMLGENLVLYNSPLTMFRELQNGTIDVAIDTVGIGTEFTRDTDLKVVAAKPNEKLSASLVPGQSAFVVQQGRQDLLGALDANIKEMHANGRIAEILTENGLDAAMADTGEPRLIG
ncbi:MAG: transporter substrate-binding domain-containing protein [Micropruina sp.]